MSTTFRRIDKPLHKAGSVLVGQIQDAIVSAARNFVSGLCQFPGGLGNAIMINDQAKIGYQTHWLLVLAMVSVQRAYGLPEVESDIDD